MGWRTEYDLPQVDKAVLCLAPHTSNWDFIIGKLIYSGLGRQVNFLIKQEWMRGPVGWWMRRRGAIGVDRDRRTSMTDKCIRILQEHDHVHLTITPEGTRKANPDWKKGFYYIALGAKVPILMLALDYREKEAKVLGLFTPTGDADADIKAIKRHYIGIQAKHPELFDLGETD